MRLNQKYLQSSHHPNHLPLCSSTHLLCNHNGLWDIGLTQSKVVLTGKGAEAQPSLRNQSPGKAPHRDVLRFSRTQQGGPVLAHAWLYTPSSSVMAGQGERGCTFHVSALWWGQTRISLKLITTGNLSYFFCKNLFKGIF